MKKISFIFMCLVLTPSILSASDIKITGKVVSLKDSTVLAGATIEFLTYDSVVIHRATTHASGEFNFRIPLPSVDGNYLLRISYLGFQPDYTVFSGRIKHDIMLGSVYMRDTSIELAEVVVERNAIIERSDRMIVMPTRSQLKSSSNSIDLLNNMYLPNLSVDVINQRTRIDGLEPVYLVNGRKQTREQVLGIKAESILRVEYSSGSSIRYMNEGAGGTINFILKEQTTGGNTFFNVTASPFTGFLNGTLSSAYHVKKSEFSLLYSTNWRDYKKRWRDRDEQLVMTDDAIHRLSKGHNAPFGYLSQKIDLGYTYIPNPGSMLSVIFRNEIGNQHDKMKAGVIQTSGTSSEINFFRTTKLNFSAYLPSLDVSYLQQLKNGQSMELNVVGTIGSSTYDRDVNDDTPLIVSNSVDNKRYSLITEGVYRKEFAINKIEFGARHNQSYTRNEYLDNLTVAGSTFTRMNAGDTYLYGQWNGRINKITYDIGTGLKIYNVNDRTDRKTFYRNMTTANVMIPLFTGFRISYRFQLRPSLPSLSQLSNVMQQNDSISVTQGNPDLKPYNNVLNRLLFTYSKKKYRANFWVSYNRSAHPISLFTYWNNNDGYFVSEYLNQRHDDKLNLQIDLSANSLFNFLSFNLSGGWNRFTAAGDSYTHTLYNLYWNINAMGTYKNYSLTFGYTHPQKNLYAETVMTNENNSYIILMYRKKQLSMSVGLYYPFNKTWQVESESLSETNPYTQKVQIKDNGQMMVVGISYDFSYGNIFRKKQKQLRNADSETGILKATGDI